MNYRLQNIFLFFTFILGFSFEGFSQTSAQTENKWETEIQAFEKQDAEKMPPKGAIVFAGSSSIRFWTDLQERFPKQTIIRRGFGGSETSDLLYFADRIITNYQPAKIFIYTGENDLAISHKKPEQAVADFQSLITHIRQKLPNTQIYIISLKPSPSRLAFFEDFKKINSALQGMLKNTKNAYFINVFDKMLDAKGQPDETLFGSDKLHLNKKGYDLWQNILQTYLH